MTIYKVLSVNLPMLKKMRTAKDATMRQVADAAGISESMYCLIESGKRRPSPDVAKKIGSYPSGVALPSLRPAQILWICAAPGLRIVFLSPVAVQGTATGEKSSAGAWDT